MGDQTIKGVEALSASQLNGKGFVCLWNAAVVDELTSKSVSTLQEYGVAKDDIVVKSVPGSFELPFAVQSLLQSQKFDAAIAIGVLIKGHTMHFEYIADSTTSGLMRVGLDTKIPVIFGVLTCLTEEQAFKRAGIGRDGDRGHNHGIDWAQAAIEMALLAKNK
ncbi:6,7-dimethyl-8-ribityllumazine synthase [Chytridium lagenaria]|nr:6,7-dimethyl-8-ribityllumazine synthase [Chytridium lagenaria]